MVYLEAFETYLNVWETSVNAALVNTCHLLTVWSVSWEVCSHSKHLDIELTQCCLYDFCALTLLVGWQNDIQLVIHSAAAVCKVFFEELYGLWNRGLIKVNLGIARTWWSVCMWMSDIVFVFVFGSTSTTRRRVSFCTGVMRLNRITLFLLTPVLMNKHRLYQQSRHSLRRRRLQLHLQLQLQLQLLVMIRLLKRTQNQWLLNQ